MGGRNQICPMQTYLTGENQSLAIKGLDSTFYAPQPLLVLPLTQHYWMPPSPREQINQLDKALENAPLQRLQSMLALQPVPSSRSGKAKSGKCTNAKVKKDEWCGCCWGSQ